MPVSHTVIITINKKLSHHRGTAQKATSVGILSTAAQLHNNFNLKRLARSGHSRSSGLPQF